MVIITSITPFLVNIQVTLINFLHNSEDISSFLACEFTAAGECGVTNVRVCVACYEVGDSPPFQGCFVAIIYIVESNFQVREDFLNKLAEFK